MSWFATKHAWAVRTVDKTAKMVMLALAYRIPQGYSSTEPTSLGVLETMTGYDPRSVRRCLDELEQVGEIDRLTRGKTATYHFRTMEGPLFAGERRKADRLSAFPRSRYPEKPDAPSGNDPDTVSEKNRTFCPPAGGVSIFQQVRTSVRTSSTPQPEAVEAFLSWFVSAYTQHRGVLYRSSSPTKTEAAVAELLVGRDPALLQAMAIAMWEDRDEPWLNRPGGNDRGVFALRQKSTYLEARVRAAATEDADDAPVMCPHVEPCAHRAMCRVKLANPDRYPVKQQQEATG